MVTLYVKTGCPFCAAVLAKVDDLGIEIDERNISEEEHLNFVIENGGMRQFPYMVDGDTAMYESADIIDYLNTKHAEGASKEGEVAAPEAAESE